MSLALGVAFLPVVFLPDRTGGVATHDMALVVFVAGVGLVALIATGQGFRLTSGAGKG